MATSNNNNRKAAKPVPTFTFSDEDDLSDCDSSPVITKADVETRPKGSILDNGKGAVRKKPCLKVTIAPSTPPNDSGSNTPDDVFNSNKRGSVSKALIHVDEIQVETTDEQVDAIKKKRAQAILKKPREYKLKAFVALLFIIMVTGIAVIVHYYNKEQYNLTLRRLSFDNFNRILTIKTDNVEVLRGELGKHMAPAIVPFDCSGEYHDSLLCWKWHKQGHVQIRRQNLSVDVLPETSECYTVDWVMDELDWPRPYDCFSLEGAFWYGGSLFHAHRLTLGNVSVPLLPYVSGSVYENSSYGPVLDRMWFSSNGIAIIVEDSSPLHVSINAPKKGSSETDNMLCLYSSYENSPYPKNPHEAPTLSYDLCVAENVRDVRLLMRPAYLGDFPNNTVLKKDLFSKTAWSTWAYFKENITSDNLLAYADEIISNEYGHHLLNIDDGWQGVYGLLEFDQVKFPDYRALLQGLSDRYFEITLWVTPYVSTEARTFQRALDRGYLVRDQRGEAPGLVRWYNGPYMPRWDRGVAAVMDTNAGATKWFGDQLVALKQRCPPGTVDGFRFDMGEVGMLPFMPVFKDQYADPNHYTRAYVMATGDAKFGGRLSQVRAGYRTQNAQAFLRVYDKNSTWGYDNGLKTVIPTMLTLGILGYPLIMPDVIGGTAYDGLPSEELYIRWLQLTAFLPIMHFSIPPHHYNETTVKIAKDMISVHQNLVYPVLLEIFVTKAYPFIKPLWWMAPKDPNAWWIDDEFLVGDKILVAPILEEGSTSRNVYLPHGKWRDRLNQNLISGPVWIKKAVPLNSIAYFVKEV